MSFRDRSAIPWEELGYEIVYYTTDSSDILEKVDLIKPDVIVTDIKMGSVTGIDILQYCEERVDKPEIILISAYEEFSYAHDALRYGAFGYLVKPIKNTELVELLVKLKEILDGKKQRSFRELEQKILENRDEISPEELFCLAGMERSGDHFCVVAVAKNYFGENRITSFFSEILPKEKIILSSGQFIYFIINRSSNQIGTDVRITEKLGEYMVCSGLSDTFGQEEVLYTYLRQAACAALQFLIGSQEPLFAYSNADRIYKEGELYRTLQMAFAKDRGQIILSQLKLLMENRNFHVLDFIGIGNYIYMNINGKEGFETYGIITLDQFLDRYQNLEDYFYELQAVIQKTFDDTAPEQPDAEMIKKYLDHHYMENIKVGDIAERFHMDMGYLGRIFKKSTGKSIKDNMVELKIERARYLLECTEMKIYEISEAVGYPDYFYFTRVFRKLTGETPSEYREKNNKDSLRFRIILLLIMSVCVLVITIFFSCFMIVKYNRTVDLFK